MSSKSTVALRDRAIISKLYNNLIAKTWIHLIKMPFDRTIVQRLHQHAREKPTAPWLVIAEGELVKQFSYGDAVDETRRMARMLAARSVGRGNHVFIALTHRYEQYILFLAAQWLGAIPTILAPPTTKQDPVLFWRDSAQMIASVRPALIITYAANLPALAAVTAEVGTPLLDIDIDGLQAELEQPLGLADWPEPADAQSNDLPFLQFTSGTTGLRKGVMLSHASVDAALTAQGEAQGRFGRYVLFTWLPLYHDMGLIACFLMPTHAGGTIIAMDALAWVAEPWRMLEMIERYKCTIAWIPNFAFQHIVNTLPPDRYFDISSMRAFVSGSEMCRPETFKRFLAALAPQGLRPEQLAVGYGMAEAVMLVALTSFGRMPRVVERDGVQRVSCGHLLPNVSARISALGELEIDARGDTVFSGYFRNADASATALNEGWYRTGDLAFIDDGELFITGRVKDMLIVHGRNYYAHDIEALASSIPGVKPGRTVAFALDNPDVGSEDAVCVAETTAPQEERVALQRAIKQTVFDHLGLMLRTVALVDPGWIVKTTSGKTSREENRKRWLARANTPIDEVAR